MWCLGRDSNPHNQRSSDFESDASTSFATQACNSIFSRMADNLPQTYCGFFATLVQHYRDVFAKINCIHCIKYYFFFECSAQLCEFYHVIWIHGS